MSVLCRTWFLLSQHIDVWEWFLLAPMLVTSLLLLFIKRFYSLEMEVFSRFEKESGGLLMKATLCLLEVSRHGLLEFELLALLGDENNIECPEYVEVMMCNLFTVEFLYLKSQRTSHKSWRCSRRTTPLKIRALFNLCCHIQLFLWHLERESTELYSTNLKVERSNFILISKTACL